MVMCYGAEDRLSLRFQHKWVAVAMVISDFPKKLLIMSSVDAEMQVLEACMEHL